MPGIGYFLFSRPSKPKTAARRAAASAVFASAVLVAMPGVCAPGEDIHKISPIVVTARGWPGSAGGAPGRVSLILYDDLRDISPVSVSDAAYLVPGAGKNADGAWGADVNIRGLSRDSVVMLIDGVRVSTATDINARFGFVDPMNISRVEILKGPVSSFHGSGSVGGVVNIITRSGRFTEPAGMRNEASVRYSSNPEGVGAYAFSSVENPTAYVAAGQSYRRFDDYKGGGGETVENSRFNDYGTLVALGRRFNEFNSFETKIQYFEGRNVGIPGRGDAPLPAAARVTYPRASCMTIMGLYSVQPEVNLVEESFVHGYYQTVERRVLVDRFPAASPLDRVEPSGDHESYGVKWVSDLDVLGSDLTGGFDLWRRNLSTERSRFFRDGGVEHDIPIPDSHFTSAGIFAENSVRIGPRVICDAGARVDKIFVANESTEQWEAMRTQDSSWNGHAGATWQLLEPLALRVIGASGYRAPGLEERYQYLELGGGKVKLGNPNLRPERSRYLEVGIEWVGDNVRVSVDAFHNRLTGLITERPLDDATLVNVNVGQAQIHGAEMKTSFEPSDALGVHAGISWAVGRDTERDEYLAGVSPVNGFTRLVWSPRRNWQARLESVFATRQDRLPDDIDETAGWAIFNAGASYRISGGKYENRFSLDAGNILDKDYNNALSSYRRAGISEPGRSVSVRYELMF